MSSERTRATCGCVVSLVDGGPGFALHEPCESHQMMFAAMDTGLSIGPDITPPAAPTEALTESEREVVVALQEFIDEGYEAVRASGDMSAAYVVGACEALRDRFARILADRAAAPVTEATTTAREWPPRVNQYVTATGVVRAVETLSPDGHYRVTLDVPPRYADTVTDWTEVHEDTTGGMG